MSVSSSNRSRRATRRRVPRAEREALMLEAGMRLFAERGYHAVSVDEVAMAAGVTKPMVYAYFESKEGLFVACCHHAEGGLLADLERSAEEHRDAEQRLWQALLTVFRFIEAHGEAWKVLYPPAGYGSSPVPAGAASTTRRMVDLVRRQMLENLHEAGLVLGEADVEPFAQAFVAATIAVGSWWQAEGTGRAEEQALRMMNFAWQGMGALMRAQLWLPPPPGAQPTPKEEP